MAHIKNLVYVDVYCIFNRQLIARVSQYTYKSEIISHGMSLYVSSVQAALRSLRNGTGSHEINVIDGRRFASLNNYFSCIRITSGLL